MITSIIIMKYGERIKLNIIKSLLNNEAVVNGLFLLTGSLLTLMGGVINGIFKYRKNKKEIEYEKHMFFVNLNHELTVYLENICKSNNFEHHHIEYFHIESLSKGFLTYLESIKNKRFDKKTTNYLYNLYELQRGLCNDVFTVEEIMIEGMLTETCYPEYIEEYHIDTYRLNELIEELQDINLKIHNRLFNI